MDSGRLIVQVAPCYVDFNSESGGVANVVRQICLGLTQHSNRVLLLCGNNELGKIRAQPGIRKINDLLTVCVLAQHGNPLRGPTAELRKRLGEAASSGTCVAHVHTCFSALTETAMSIFSERRIPFVFTPHGKLTRYMLSKHFALKWLWWHCVARRQVQKSASIALCSAVESVAFSALGLHAPWTVVPNGYSLPPLAPTAFLAEKPFVLFLGYLDARKQPEFLVRAFAQSTTRFTHQLLFVGPDEYEYRKVIAREVEKQGLGSRVIFAGALYGADKWACLTSAACLCLPSRGEGLPVVMCEALGAGVPQIYSTDCNFNEVASAGAGIMVDGFNPNEWASAIDRVCLHSETADRMRIAAKELSAEYTWQKAIDKWVAIYDSIELKKQ